MCKMYIRGLERISEKGEKITEMLIFPTFLEVFSLRAVLETGERTL